MDTERFLDFSASNLLLGNLSAWLCCSPQIESCTCSMFLTLRGILFMPERILCLWWPLPSNCYFCSWLSKMSLKVSPPPLFTLCHSDLEVLTQAEFTLPSFCSRAVFVPALHGKTVHPSSFLKVPRPNICESSLCINMFGIFSESMLHRLILKQVIKNLLKWKRPPIQESSGVQIADIWFLIKWKIKYWTC